MPTRSPPRTASETPDSNVPADATVTEPTTAARGGAVAQRAAGARGQRPGKLAQLPVLDGQAAAGGVGVHVEAPVGHDLPGLLAHPAPVDDAGTAARLAAEEAVLRHGQAGYH